MLLEKARKHGDRIKELERLRGIARSIEGFQTRANMLHTPVAMLDAHVVILTELRKRGIEVHLQDVSSAAKMLNAHVNQIAADFEANPDAIVESGERLRREFWEMLSGGGLTTAVRSTLMSAWKSHVDALLPSLNPELLETLERVPTFAPKVRQIRTLHSQARRCEERLPQSEGDFTRLTSLVSSLEKSWQGLSGEGIPDDVLAFLKAAVGDGAELDLMTPAVTEWLERHGLKKNLRVMF